MLIYHPKRGTILVCDFDKFEEPEMTKRRPVIVLSNDMKSRNGLCTVVALSTTEPFVITPYHYKLILDPPLPCPYNSKIQWVKGDMIYTLAFSRFNLMYKGKDESGKRLYDIRVVDKDDMGNIEKCVMNGLGITV